MFYWCLNRFNEIIKSPIFNNSISSIVQVNSQDPNIKAHNDHSVATEHLYSERMTNIPPEPLPVGGIIIFSSAQGCLFFADINLSGTAGNVVFMVSRGR